MIISVNTPAAGACFDFQNKSTVHLNTSTVPFQPEKLMMFSESGDVYHHGPVGGVGLVKSSLALELSPFFIYKAQAKAWPGYCSFGI